MSAPVSVQLMELTRAAEDAPAAADRHTTQSFEIGSLTGPSTTTAGRAVSRLGLPWNTASRYGDFEESPWERYNIEEDLCDVLGYGYPLEKIAKKKTTTKLSMHAPLGGLRQSRVLASSNFAVPAF